MKIRFWAATNRVGSKVTRTVEVPDEDLEGLSEAERERVLSEYGRDELDNMIEWGWEEES